MSDPCLKLEVKNSRSASYSEEGEAEGDAFMEFLRFNPADRIIVSPATPNPRRGRNTFSRQETIRWSRGHYDASPRMSETEEQVDFQELFDWTENDFEDNGHSPSPVFNSIRKSLGNAEEKIRAYTQDYSMYVMTLTSAYIVFALVSGIILAYFIHSNIYNHHRDFQSKYHNAVSSNATKNLTHFVEHQVDLRCSQYQIDWQSSSDCKIKNLECLQRFQKMEEEISSLRQQYIKNLTLKQESIHKLIRAVTKHREDHVFVKKASINQFFTYLSGFGASAYGAYRFYCRH